MNFDFNQMNFVVLKYLHFLLRRFFFFLPFCLVDQILFEYVFEYYVEYVLRISTERPFLMANN